MSTKNKTKHLKKDPHAKREQSNYEQPIPSREYILEYFSQQDRFFNRPELAERLGLSSDDEIEALRRRLIAMCRDGQLFCNRNKAYGPIDKFDLVRGRVDSHPDGFGFLHPDDGSEKMFITFKQMRTLMHGDKVLVRVAGLDRRGRREGALVEVLARGVTQIVGRLFIEHNISFVVPDDKKFQQDVMIPEKSRHNAEHGQIVIADIVEYPSKRNQPIGRIVEVLGDHMAPGMEIDIAIRSHNLPSDWPAAVHQEVVKFADTVDENDYAGRKDMRDLPFVTIDGEDARDFDDAVYCEASKKNWIVWVAIADVANYVGIDSALDKEAINRGNSVYFPERVIPMLPEKLSNGLCSLKPKVDRLALVCEMNLNPDGKVTRYRFFNAVINSHARLTYEQVAGMLYEGHVQTRKKYEHLFEHLKNLDTVYATLRHGREKRGAIDFESSESRILFGTDKKIERIVPTIRNDAHRIIEECMIAANVCAAEYLQKNKVPTLYRVHDTPDMEKVSDVRDFLGPFGLALTGGKKPVAKDYADLLSQVKHRPDARLIQTVLLRSMRQAEYSPENLGHFGLAHKAYTHFTSPIRRYPDLLIHRAIKYLVSKKLDKPAPFPYLLNHMNAFGEECSMTERRADDATRDVMAWLKCEFMMEKIGEQFSGIISSVTSFGLFIELDAIHVEGLAHITTLGDDYFHFDPISHSLNGERTGKLYRLGDQITIELVHVSLDERKIDFEVLGDH